MAEPGRTRTSRHPRRRYNRYNGTYTHTAFLAPSPSLPVYSLPALPLTSVEAVEQDLRGLTVSIRSRLRSSLRVCLVRCLCLFGDMRFCLQMCAAEFDVRKQSQVGGEGANQTR